LTSTEQLILLLLDWEITVNSIDPFSRYEDAVARFFRGESPPVILEDEDESGPDDNDDDDNDFVAPVVFDMLYRSAGRAVSRRRVRLIKMRKTLAETYLCCFCFERNAYREFKLTGVLEVIDITTGEVFDSGREFLEACGAIAAETPESQALSLCAHDLTVLAFLGSCDGRFLPSEVDEVVRHVGRCAGFAFDEDAVRRAVANLAPDARAFRSALRRFEGDEERRRALVRAVRAVINADRIAHENEIMVGGQILKMLGVEFTD
jgi:hypothetical protein